jgi:hypothetical protein
MTIGFFHPGSGIGNQLHRYIATRLSALVGGEPFAMIGDFKGKSFMQLKTYDVEMPSGKIEYDEVKFMDGEFQGEHIWGDSLPIICDWLKVESLDMPENLCVINFRGGEYVGVSNLFLPKSYWDEAIEKMRQINPDMRFEVHTDDVVTARQFFPDFTVIHNVSTNWRSIRYAHYLILSNSSFAILPSYLNENVKKIIAPNFWAGHNEGKWVNPDNNYSKFTYI